MTEGTSFVCEPAPGWVDEALAEADQMSIDDLKNNEEIQKIILSSKKATMVVMIEGVPVTTVSFISKPVRRKLQNASKLSKIGGADLDQISTAMCEVLALICVDPPYNSAKTWEYLDENGGDLSSYLSDIMTGIAENSQKVKDFRRK